MGRFRYWLLGDLILKGWSDHATSPDLSRPYFEVLNVPERYVNTNEVYLVMYKHIVLKEGEDE
jgi:hypothetical protein